MGKFQGTGYVNLLSAKPNTLMRPAAAKASGTEPAPAPKLERVAKMRKAVTSSAEPTLAVTPKSHVTPNSGKASESRKRGRPRVLSDEQRREKVRQRVAGWRVARRKEKVQ